MTAYLIANNHLTDYAGKLDAYRGRVTELAASFGGRYLARGAPTKVLEGQWLPRQRNVMSAWRDASATEAFWFSDAYQKDLRPNRVGTSVNDVAIFQGEGDPPAEGGDAAYLLVFAQLTAPVSPAYSTAVAKLSVQYGGRYLTRGAPYKVVEGVWLDRVRVVLSAWPSLQAATDYWYSDAYQKEIKPLRAGSGVYDVALFQAEKH